MKFKTTFLKATAFSLLIIVLIMLISVSGIMAQTAALPSAGDGTKENPYQIGIVNILY